MIMKQERENAPLTGGQKPGQPATDNTQEPTEAPDAIGIEEPRTAVESGDQKNKLSSNNETIGIP
jgi:hypothetical protein